MNATLTEQSINLSLPNMRLNYIITLISGLFLLLPLSCSREEEWEPEESGFEMIINPQVTSPATRSVDVPSVQALQEDAVDSLNVYFYGTFQGDSSPSLKHFFLKSATDKTGTNSWRVTSDWRSEGFVSGNSYDMYVVANSRQVKTASETSGTYLHSATGPLSAATVSDLASLKSMIEFDYDPSEQNGEGGHKPYWGSYDEDNLNPEWLNLHKKYLPSSTFEVSTGSSQQRRFYTNEKSFLMDGKTSFTAGSTEAIPLELTRAAAKVVIDVKFDSAFLASLATNNIEVTGAPAWRFFNFSFSTPVIDPSLISGTQEAYNKSVFVAGAIMMGKSDIDTDLVYSSDSDKHFSFSTYTYPTSWSVSSATAEAPAIILSLGYLDNTSGTISYQAYKVPVVDPTGSITAIERNKLYRISATIASEGGELMTDAYKVRCNYDVIPWGAIPINSEEIGQVDHSDNDYFDVSPTSITLRGDGLQKDSLHIIKPNKRNFKIKYITLPSATVDAPFNIPSTPDTTHTNYPFDGNDIAQNQPAPYYFNYQGTKRNAFLSTKYVGSVEAGTTTYLQNRFTREDKYLIIESCSLPNLTDKFMMIRVYLDVPDWETRGFYRDITIRHYATTRITHKIGAWSSRISACSALDPSDPNYVAFNTSTGPYGPEEYRYTSGVYALNGDNVPSSSQAFRNYRWVNYAVDQTGTHTYRTHSRGNANNPSSTPFRPKYYNGSSVYYMNANNTSTGGRVVQGNNISTFNPSMYIVQSSSASSSYVTGRPYMDENSLSQDRVLSPAFMIASQLGAISNLPTTGTYSASEHGISRVGSTNELIIWEAMHCSTYLEVGVDGTYYKNWRLPTEEEIGVIIGLQSGIDADSALNKVLTGSFYRALDGNEVDSGERPQGNTTHTVRCVRDLTQAEIDALNI